MVIRLKEQLQRDHFFAPFQAKLLKRNSVRMGRFVPNIEELLCRGGPQETGGQATNTVDINKMVQPLLF